MTTLGLTGGSLMATLTRWTAIKPSVMSKNNKIADWLAEHHLIVSFFFLGQNIAVYKLNISSLNIMTYIFNFLNISCNSIRVACNCFGTLEVNIISCLINLDISKKKKILIKKRDMF